MTNAAFSRFAGSGQGMNGNGSPRKDAKNAKNDNGMDCMDDMDGMDADKHGQTRTDTDERQELRTRHTEGGQAEN